MPKKINYIGRFIPGDTNEHGILIWDIKCAIRIANDLNRSLGLKPPIKVLPVKFQTKKEMYLLRNAIMAGLEHLDF